MKTKLLIAVAGLAMPAFLAGCGGVLVVGHPYRHRTVVYAEPVYVQPQPEPVYIEEGAVAGGVVVAAPDYIDSYVLIDGGWYYWHPRYHQWVHAYRPQGWHPGPNVVVYRSWAEHPMYRPVVVARPAPGPVVVQPAPVVVAPAAPAYVEEGAVVGGVVVTPPAFVDGYVFLNGGWFYWHPSLHLWIHAVRPQGWHPGGNVHVYHDWSEHPMYHAAVVVQPAPVVVAPAAPVYVEEGAVVGGVVVTPPAVIDGYVFINGGWFYWHPTLHLWIHAIRPQGWRPGGNVHVYHEWAEHPMYHH